MADAPGFLGLGNKGLISMGNKMEIREQHHLYIQM